MTRARLFDLLAFASYYVVAALIGRLTVLDGADLALAWPAAGVAVAWCAVTGWRRPLAVDLAAIVVLSWGINVLTGTGVGLATALTAGALVQIAIFGVLLSAWCPTLWGFGDDPPPGIESMRELGYLTAAAFLSAVVAAMSGPTTILFLNDGSWDSLLAWIVRNAVAVLAIFPISLLARNVTRSSGRGLDGLGRGSLIEAAGVVLVTTAVLWGVFFRAGALPVAFLVLGTCVWAGIRFSAWVSHVHALVVSGAVIVATLRDMGPFAGLDLSNRELVVQCFVGAVVALDLTVSVARRELLLVAHRLARSEAASQEQAALMRTILDVMADGVTVLDGSGELVLRNPAATHLVGNPRLDSRGRVGSNSSGIFYADGTRVDRDAGLFLRALEGEEMQHVDLVVRTPTAPDGRMLEVTTRPLPDTDPPLVVVVFHDVTADRRERDELASFAGVVAHDLLNPLTVVEGWSEALLEEARAGVAVPPAMQADQLERIVRAAQRMQHLISDLLAYTTARDLKINPVRVDLHAVAVDVARARVDAARVQDAIPPRITVLGDLPDVLAEPVLLRQVIDNLVGNAVKYVAAGVGPEICVSATVLPDEEEPRMVQVEVSDNGIGIPEDQQSRVFDTFHRAHTDGGYRGTGLGLSIVKRIAERHEGTAWASTNPATGGTTMTVTFPAAD